MRKKAIAKDFLLNLAASLISSLMTQVVLYPILGRALSVEKYGVLLTLIGIANTVALTFGGSLNNTRLIQNAQYKDCNVEGDFLPLCMILTVMNVVTVGICFINVSEASVLQKALLMMFSCFLALRSYGCVAFRLVINYKKLLLLNAAVAVGDLIGLIFAIGMDIEIYWPVPFLVGEMLGVGYIFATSSIFRERIGFTKLATSTAKKEFVLMLTTLLGNLLTYLDRLLLLPVLGGPAVATYTVASFFGKSLSILMTPMSGVLLSYYAQKDYRMTRERFRHTYVAVFLVSVGFFAVCIVFSRWATGLFYPTLIEQAIPYLLLANGAALVNAAANMVQPAVLKFAPIKWQLITQGLYGGCYLAGGIIGAKSNGIMGFCVSAVIASFIRLLILLSIGAYNIGNRKDVSA